MSMKYIVTLLKFVGREHYFAEDYEKPEENFLDIDTTNISVDECISKILKEFVSNYEKGVIHRKMATFASWASMAF